MGSRKTSPRRLSKPCRPYKIQTMDDLLSDYENFNLSKRVHEKLACSAESGSAIILLMPSFAFYWPFLLQLVLIASCCFPSSKQRRPLNSLPFGTRTSLHWTLSNQMRSCHQEHL